MVYCNYLRNTDSVVEYIFGETTDDLTGNVVYDYKQDIMNIIKEPDDCPVMPRHLQSVFRKHRNEFINGELKKKIAYEA